MLVSLPNQVFGTIVGSRERSRLWRCPNPIAKVLPGLPRFDELNPIDEPDLVSKTRHDSGEPFCANAGHMHSVFAVCGSRNLHELLPLCGELDPFY